MRDDAIAYVARGLAVLPCAASDKVPLTEHGVRDATTADDVVYAWWTDHPDANIGIATGAISGIVAIDVDPRHGGDVSLAELEREHGPLPATVEAYTGGGGRHLIFAHPGGTIRNRSNVRPGIDVRGDGGYIVAPPSVHACGGLYRWRECRSIHDIDPHPLPEWLLSLIRPPEPERAAAPSEPAGDTISIVYRLAAAAQAMRRIRARDATDGSRRVLIASTIAVRYGLPDDVAVAAIRDYLAECPAPRSYRDHDILRRIRDAEANHERGEALDAECVGDTCDDIERRPYPLDAWPDSMRDAISAVAEGTCTDPSYAATAALVIAAGCVGNRAAVEVSPGWHEPAILWGALVGRSGTLKSPVLHIMSRPLVEIGRAQRQEYERRRDEYRRSAEDYHAALASWRRKPSGDRPDPPAPPIETRYLVSDITIEKLGALLECNPRGLLLVRDELAAWIGSFDRYVVRAGADQPAWLSLYDARPLVIDRKADGGSYYVPRGAVSVLGTIQPGTLARVFGTPEREAGLLARLLLVHPPEQAVRWRPDGMSVAALDAWRDIVSGLLEIRPAEQDDRTCTPCRLALAADAADIWRDWHDRHAEEVRDTIDDDYAAASAKMRGMCARIALVLTCIDVVSRRAPAYAVGADTISRAVLLTEWHKHESRRIYASLDGGRGDGPGRQLLQWLRDHGGATTPRELVRSHTGYRGRMAAARRDLAQLARRNLCVILATRAARGRPQERYVLAERYHADLMSGPQSRSRDCG